MVEKKKENENAERKEMVSILSSSSQTQEKKALSLLWHRERDF